jgi:exonuclease 1
MESERRMGIQNLLPFLKSIEKPKHLSEYRGLVCGIDGYVFLHKGIYCSAKEISESKNYDKLIKYCISRVKQLIDYGIKPYVVFDGEPLPSKSSTEIDRETKRRNSLQKATDLKNDGLHDKAYSSLVQSIEVTPYMAKLFADALKKLNVPFIVAPYEADAQLAFLSKQKLIDFVISEDSDLLTFGCDRILYKLDMKTCRGIEIERCLMMNQIFPGFSDEDFQIFCILCGCDYLASLPTVSAKKAMMFIQKCVINRNYVNVLKLARYSGIFVSQEYEQKFHQALLTFKHQIIYDTSSTSLKPLTPTEDAAIYDFCGEIYASEIAKQVAECLIDPFTKEPFIDEPPSPEEILADKENKAVIVLDDADRPHSSKRLKRTVIAGNHCVNDLASLNSFIYTK